MDRVTRFLPFEDSRGKFSFRTMFSYIFDYAIIIVLAIGYAILDKVVTPFSQRFSLSDAKIMYPFAEKERIPIMEAVLISGGFPIVAIAVYTLVIDGLFSHSKQKGFKKYTFKQRLWELNCGILGLLLAQGAAFCITGTLKNLIGRPRPDFISRCIPRAEPGIGLYELATKDICTRDDPYIMQDAFRSFPSGHSSSSFAGLGYLSLYLAGKLHIFDQRGEVWRTVIVIIPVLAASCIAASRIMDYRHHPFDVLFGSAIGLLCAWGAYRQYFPALSETNKKGRAHPMREWGVSITRDDSDYHGTALYNSGRADSSTNVVSRQGQGHELPYYQPKYPAHIDEESQMYRMNPVRVPGRSDAPSPALKPTITSQSQSPSDETDYEVIRPKAGQVGPAPSQGTSRDGSSGTNVFRDQVHRNQSQRRSGTEHSDDEDELRTGHRSPLMRPTMI